MRSTSEPDVPDVSGLIFVLAGQCSPQLPGASNINRFDNRLPRVVDPRTFIGLHPNGELVLAPHHITHAKLALVVPPC